MATKAFTDLRVLVVDDAPDMVRLIHNMLRSFGISKVEDARDGQEALMMAKRFRPGFMIVDWEMEPMDGYTLVHHLRSESSGLIAKVPVIMMSANGEPARIQAARRIGVSHFILKPIVPNRLAERIQWALDHPVDLVLEGDQWLPREFAGRPSDAS